MRPLILLEFNAVEHVTAGFHANFSQHLRASTGFQSDAKDERFRDRLNGELGLAISVLMNLTVDVGHCHAKPLRVGLGQLWNVGGNRPFFAIVLLLVQVAK